jgi:hypothetical protein
MLFRRRLVWFGRTPMRAAVWLSLSPVLAVAALVLAVVYGVLFWQVIIAVALLTQSVNTFIYLPRALAAARSEAGR